jgi:hypothetical protein
VEWGWVDEDGKHMHERYSFDPYERLNKLAAISNKDARYAAAMQEYSRLKVDLDFGGWLQMHVPSAIQPEPRADQPDHCGQPAYLAPAGWQCRECKAWLDTLPPVTLQ